MISTGKLVTYKRSRTHTKLNEIKVDGDVLHKWIPKWSGCRGREKVNVSKQKHSSTHHLNEIKAEVDVFHKLDSKVEWVRIPKNGESLCRKMVHLFIEDIERWVTEVNNENCKKMRATQMKATLGLKFPMRDDLLTEQNV